MTESESSSNASQSRRDTATSRSLLVRVRQNEAAAWERLVTLYTPLVYYWCRKMELAEQEIPDVVQEVFKAVTAGIGRFRNDRPGDTFRGWLRTITRSKVLDFYRRDNRGDHGAGGTDAQHRFLQVPVGYTEDIDSSCLDADESFEEEQIRNQIFRNALQVIRGDFRENTWKAFWRVVVDGLSPKEVGEELSMQPGAVRVAKSRVLHRLREELGELMD